MIWKWFEMIWISHLSEGADAGGGRTPEVHKSLHTQENTREEREEGQDLSLYHISIHLYTMYLYEGDVEETTPACI